MTTWDPKVGFVITPAGGTTFRAAYFETTGTAGIREFELIEPTTMSGFNQTFFDVFPGTRARNTAIGIDQKFDSKTYIGAEAMHRSLKRKFPLSVSSLYFDSFDGSLQDQEIFVQEDDAHIDEDIAKGYIYQVLHRTTTATLDYLWNRDKDNYYGSEAKTNRVRTGVNYFDSSGFLTFARGTWRDQSLKGFFEYDENGAELTNDFWILDVGAGYRIPNRRGQIVLTLTNLLDKDFYYLPSGIDPLVLPGFGATLAFSYNF